MTHRILPATSLALLLACGAADDPNTETAEADDPGQGTAAIDDPSEPPADTEQSAEPAAAGATDEQRIGGVIWRVEIDPPTVADSAVLRVSVENPEHQDYRPRSPDTFTIDGEPSHGLSLRFTNGVMGPNWDTLPSGETAVIEREVADLLAEPGEHRIGVQIGETTLTVVATRN